MGCNGVLTDYRGVLENYPRNIPFYKRYHDKGRVPKSKILKDLIIKKNKKLKLLKSPNQSR